MALRTIRTAGDPVLEKKCREVKEMTPRIKELIKDMYETMYDGNGVGLAAPQVGILRRICVIDCTGEDPYTLINPVIVESDGEQTGDEGCLSYPGKVGTVTRPMRVVVEAYNENWEKIRLETEELMARAVCHELDHLDGHMYMEKVEGPIREVESDSEEENG
ncbi:MAG: peptide deformylase [Lachnospiraceae bacterium]|nr:peptide deformylase [Lachnospiraceae bacterium]